MLYNASPFHQDIWKWDVSKGTRCSSMFYGTSSFDEGFLKWDVSKGTNFNCMLYDATLFDQDLGKSDVSKGTNFSIVFYDSISFDQPFGKWDVSKGAIFGSMFYDAVPFVLLFFCLYFSFWVLGHEALLLYPSLCFWQKSSSAAQEQYGNVRRNLFVMMSVLFTDPDIHDVGRRAVL